METFVSEPIEPAAADSRPGAAIEFDTAAMSRGEPGLPGGFRWRGETYLVRRVIRRWKQSGSEIGRANGEKYLRRHCFELAMSDDSVWSVYFLRLTPRSGSPRRRWFLYSIARSESPTADDSSG